MLNGGWEFYLALMKVVLSHFLHHCCYDQMLPSHSSKFHYSHFTSRHQDLILFAKHALCTIISLFLTQNVSINKIKGLILHVQGRHKLVHNRLKSTSIPLGVVFPILGTPDLVQTLKIQTYNTEAHNFIASFSTNQYLTMNK